MKNSKINYFRKVVNMEGKLLEDFKKSIKVENNYTLQYNNHRYLIVNSEEFERIKEYYEEVLRYVLNELSRPFLADYFDLEAFKKDVITNNIDHESLSYIYEDEDLETIDFMNKRIVNVGLDYILIDISGYELDILDFMECINDF